MISTRPASPTTLLGIYLNDHAAAAVAGLELARRCQASNRGTALGRDLAIFVTEAGEDREQVLRLLRRLGVPEDRKKRAAAFVAERVARLKLNGQLLGYSDLSRLVELEALCSGVEAKLSLWRSLQQVAGGEAVGADLDHLVARAQRHREMLEGHRLEAARRAFSGALEGT